MRKPVAAFAIDVGTEYEEMRVVCDDGSVWELSSDTDHITVENEFGYFWHELPPIPGTNRNL
jgi:hypothetical protein